ncbi:retrovirus-related pol polyprotein from transposon TNT 1-94 [Tanacetum coccineum]
MQNNPIVSDPNVMVSFPILDDKDGASFVAWRTTPWTLPSNLALCVNSDLVYVKVSSHKVAYFRIILSVFHQLFNFTSIEIRSVNEERFFGFSPEKGRGKLFGGRRHWWDGGEPGAECAGFMGGEGRECMELGVFKAYDRQSEASHKFRLEVLGNRLGHNLFSVGQFCNLDLEVAFRRNTYFVRNLEGVDLLKGNHTTNLYTINLHEMASASLIYLMARATSTKSWLWHQRLSHLNFDTITDLAKNNLRLHLLHMNLCVPMRVESINGKQYVLVIVDDYSCYMWVHFLRSKDEAPEVIKTFLKRIQVLLQALIIIVRTDNGTKFKNQVLKEYFDSVDISHQSSSVRTPKQNGVVERRNRTLMEAARTMLIFSCAPLFLWAEAIATACYTQNRSIIHRRSDKTPYKLINGRKLDIFFLHVFGALCYPKNDHEDIGKLGAKVDIGFFIGYSANSCAYKVYNRRTKKIIETMNVTFDELSAMAFEQSNSKPGLQGMNSGQITMYDDYVGGQPSAAPRTALATSAPQVLQTPTTSTTTADTAPTPTNLSSQATNIPNTSQDVDELEPQQQHV